MSKLIVDNPNMDKFKFITESMDGNKNGPSTYVLEGVYAMADAKNGNGRVYPYELLKKEIEEFDKNMIQTGRALGALEHPDHPEILPAESAIRILELKEDNNKSWIGKSCILASLPEYKIKGTPNGDLLLSLVQYGTKIGFSTRALGDVTDDGTVTDLKLCTIDAVFEPSIGLFCKSNGNRFVNGILESKQWVCNNHGEYIEKKFNSFEKHISKMPNTHISSKKNKYLAEGIFDFLNSLKK